MDLIALAWNSQARDLEVKENEYGQPGARGNPTAPDATAETLAKMELIV